MRSTGPAIAGLPLPLWRNGRRERLKIVCRKACPFESGQGHQDFGATSRLQRREG